LGFQFGLTLRFKLQSFAPGHFLGLASSGLLRLALGGQFSRAPGLFISGETLSLQLGWIRFRWLRLGRLRLGGTFGLGDIRRRQLGFGQIRSRRLDPSVRLRRRTLRRSSPASLQIRYQRLQRPIRDQIRLNHARLRPGVERGLQDIDPDEEQQRKE
jgi:hypothetical protein